MKLKRIMMGTKIWNILSLEFKIKIFGSKYKFKREQEYDGPLLWDFIQWRINPSMIFGASILKDEIKLKITMDFSNNIIKYNIWLDDTRDLIIKEDGRDRYNEYIFSIFRAYLSCNIEEFITTIKDKKKKWTQGKLGANYSHRDLEDIGWLTYKNLVSNKLWTRGVETKAKEHEKIYIALATQMMQKISIMQKNLTTRSPDEKGGKLGG